MAASDDEDTPAPEPPPVPPKRHWEPPRIRSGQLFESNSLACTGKSGPGIFECQMEPPFKS
jgi:hypothetical protein